MILLSVLDMDINDMFIQSIYNVEEAGIKEFHIDVMDGKFVKNNNLDNMYEKFKIIDNISILKKRSTFNDIWFERKNRWICFK